MGKYFNNPIPYSRHQSRTPINTRTQRNPNYIFGPRSQQQQFFNDFAAPSENAFFNYDTFLPLQQQQLCLPSRFQQHFDSSRQENFGPHANLGHKQIFSHFDSSKQENLNYLGQENGSFLERSSEEKEIPYSQENASFFGEENASFFGQENDLNDSIFGQSQNLERSSGQSNVSFLAHLSRNSFFGNPFLRQSPRKSSNVFPHSTRKSFHSLLGQHRKFPKMNRSVPAFRNLPNNKCPVFGNFFGNFNFYKDQLEGINLANQTEKLTLYEEEDEINFEELILNEEDQKNQLEGINFAKNQLEKLNLNEEDQKINLDEKMREINLTEEIALDKDQENSLLEDGSDLDEKNSLFQDEKRINELLKGE